MSSLTKLEFNALAVNGGNYLSWQLDAKLHLQSKKLGDAIEEGNKMSPEEKASALIFLRHHIHDDLKNEYLTEKDPYRPKEENEEILGPEVPYMSAIGALLYLAQSTRPDISFSVNLLARFSSAPTYRHWTGIKHIFRYLRGTIDMGLFYSSDLSNHSHLVGYADSGYLSDPHKGRSQTGYVFLNNNAAISWLSTKQNLVATSSNHSEILALHEASRECVWLRSLVQHIRSSCQLTPIVDEPSTIYEDNAACIAQIQGGFIKGDRVKHISPKIFFTHELQENREIEVKQIRSSDNLADLFTKALPKSIFQKLVYGIGMRRLNHQTN